MPQSKTRVSRVSKVTDASLRGVKRRSNLKEKIATTRKTGLAMTKDQPTKTGGLTVSVFDLSGKSVAKVTLPKEIFGQEPNKNLLSQAIHIYEANARPSTAHTKTRGEVRGGGTKPWRQKGTGRARAGSIRSPLWVGGGTTFGPRAKNARLSLPAKMKHQALISALSAKRQAGDIKVVKSIESIRPKTKIVAGLLPKLQTKGNTLLVTSAKNQNLKLATRNIQRITLDTPPNLNAYAVLKNRTLLLSEEAITKFK
ncbi:50S ribosomal protein L4 [Candidatus Curtissbacteria bacterium]|nr:50S ribosomal protein L4 [Candidatus Curtissbacteria bacterium]